MTYTENVIKTTFHQCMYGLMGVDREGPAPAYKPTSVLTNNVALAGVLQSATGDIDTPNSSGSMLAQELLYILAACVRRS